MSASVLDAIMAGARTAALERSKTSRGQVERDAARVRLQSHSFEASLKVPGVRIIAECKRRSPSRGILRRDYDPVTIAAGYARAGAAAVSVLTEPTFFDGDLDHLRAVRTTVQLPVLRKDFISTEFQVAEARAAGANAILLIVAGLEDRELGGMMASAAAHDLSALVEVHSREEAQRAIDHGARIVGVNSRDLRTLQVSLSVFEDVLPVLPRECVKVAESGITNVADVRRLKALGFDACLIGERFMTRADPGAALADFLAGAESGGTS
jgi:indole-3-glycerol phosphate synthase